MLADIGQFPTNLVTKWAVLVGRLDLFLAACSQHQPFVRQRVRHNMTEIPPSAHDGHSAPNRPAISFEFFPPKTEEMEKSLWDTIKRLAPLTPNFVSVTYGAGGSTRERTHSTIARILTETGLLPAAPPTCVGAARGEIDDIVERYR